MAGAARRHCSLPAGDALSAAQAILLVLAGFAAIAVVEMSSIVAGKLARRAATWRNEPLRRRMGELPVSVALREEPPPAPRRGRARAVALELVVEGSQQLGGRSRGRAVQWLERNGYVEEGIRGLRRSRRGWRRAEAAMLLGRMGSRRAAGALAGGLADHRFRVRDACATALGHVGGPEQVPALVWALERRSVNGILIGGALLRLGPDADPELAAALGHPDPQVRELVARVLGARRSQLAVPRLVDGLHDPAAGVRRQCALALAELAGAGTHVPAAPVRALVRDEAAIVRSAAATALGAVLGDTAAPDLLALVRDDEYWVSYRAAEALCRLPSGEDLGWGVLAEDDEGPGVDRARRACLEWLQRTGSVEPRLAALVELGGEDLAEALRWLRRAGSVAWARMEPFRASEDSHWGRPANDETGRKEPVRAAR